MPGAHDNKPEQWVPWDELNWFRTQGARRCSFQQLSAATGMSKGYLCDLERGRREPSHEVYTKLAEALGVPQYILRKRTRAERRMAA